MNIKIEGTQIGKKATKNGEFKISARKGDILIFTYVGMKNERIKIKDFNDLKINIMQVSVSELEGIELKGIDKQMIESRKIITIWRLIWTKRHHMDIQENKFKVFHLLELQKLSR